MEISERGARFLLALMAVLGVVAAFVVWPLLTPVFLGLVAAFVLRPLYRRILRVVRKPWIAAGAVVALALVVLLGPFVFVVQSLVDDAAALGQALSDGALQEQLEETFRLVGAPPDLAETLTQVAGAQLQRLALQYAQDLVPTLFWFFIGLFVFFFILFYGLVQGPDMVSFLRDSVPLRRSRMSRLLQESARSVDAVFKGELLVAVVQGLVAGVGWWLFGYPNPVFWGFVMTLLSIIPWTGAPLVIVPVGLYTAATGDWVRGLGFVAFGVVLVGFIDNVLRPFVIGRRGSIHPAIVLVGVVGGLAALGVVGLFLGPLVLVLLRAVILVWNEAEVAEG